ncbi:2-hydroxyacid dehydrogenase [Collimonas silvisoli]|uniref:2-hydroxyacid dehydrogenase n=1 Tax=Collimonas silvisoli TaxID=2825884 RepID=UPI001B8C41EC|nr:glyoxylate/hydroxypyruvate reductase A [Collimonas silvisoli]
MSFLYKADPVRGAEWARLFAEQAPDIPFHCWPDYGAAEQVRYLAAWLPPENLASQFPNVEVVFSVGAGIDQFDFSLLPPDIPVVRMIEPGIAVGMVEYVTHAVLAIHRQSHLYARLQREQRWQEHPIKPAASCRIGVLGLGVMGQSVLSKLRDFGFPCAGWSRSAHALDGVDCYAGEDALPAFLARSDILICLLPLTQHTRGILNRKLFNALPAGAAVINVGRGGHLDEAALLEALASGQLSSATLDVCEIEPLPAGHPFWEHPNIVLTPHIASMTQPASAVEVVLDNIRRHQSGQPLIGLVDRSLGY